MPQTQPPKKSRGRRVLIILLTLIPPLLILMLRPLGFSLQQSGILACPGAHHFVVGHRGR